MPHLPFSAGHYSTVAAYWAAEKAGSAGAVLLHWADHGQPSAYYERQAARRVAAAGGFNLWLDPPEGTKWDAVLEPKRKLRIMPDETGIMKKIALHLGAMKYRGRMILHPTTGPAAGEESFRTAAGFLFKSMGVEEYDLLLPFLGKTDEDIAALAARLGKGEEGTALGHRASCTEALTLCRGCDLDEEEACGACQGCKDQDRFFALVAEAVSREAPAE